MNNQKVDTNGFNYRDLMAKEDARVREIRQDLLELKLQQVQTFIGKTVKVEMRDETPRPPRLAGYQDFMGVIGGLGNPDDDEARHLVIFSKVWTKRESGELKFHAFDMNLSDLISIHPA